jgi:hypothetical protein
MSEARAAGSHCCPDTLLAVSCLLCWLLFGAGLLLPLLLAAVVVVAVLHRIALLLLLMLLLPACVVAAFCRESQCASIVITEFMQDHCTVCSACNTARAASCWLVPSGLLVPMAPPLPLPLPLVLFMPVPAACWSL